MLPLNNLTNEDSSGLSRRPEGGLRRAVSRFTARNSRLLRQHRGFTFIELLVVSTLLIILASAVMPMARVTMQRQREAELRRALREMRTAIDKFKDAADAGLIGAMDLKTGAEGYPAALEILVEGVSVVNDQSGRKLKFLRRIPIDPMTNSTEWGKRSYQDKSDATSWGGQNVFDVYTKSEGTALDGTKYRDW
jgi:general secretion pathway protein G